MPPNKFNLFFQPQNKFDPSIWTCPVCDEKLTCRQGVYNEHVDQCRRRYFAEEAAATAAESASAVTTAAADSTQAGPTLSTSRVKDVPTIKEATKTTTQVIQNIM